ATGPQERGTAGCPAAGLVTGWRRGSGAGSIAGCSLGAHCKWKLLFRQYSWRQPALSLVRIVETALAAIRTFTFSAYEGGCRRHSVAIAVHAFLFRSKGR